jgi:hypothetical protein
MARVESFVQVNRTGGYRLHPTTVVCGVEVYEVGGRRVIQLDTYGAEDRDIPDKVSQTLQLDEAAARQLVKILQAAFP